MNESILKALMQLFAIIIEVEEELTEKEFTLVESYLKRHLNQEQTKQYVQYFTEYYNEVHKGKLEKDSKKARKRVSLNAIKVLQFCEQINQVLQQDQKILVFMQLMEFLSIDKTLSENELDFAQTVCSSFNIPDEEFYNVKCFVLDDFENVKEKEKEKFLIADKNKEFAIPEFKHFQNEHLNGNIVIIYIQSTNMYFFRYVGDDNIFLNSINIIPTRIYVLDKGSSIRSPKITTIYYSDVAGKFLESQTSSKVIFSAKDVEFRFKNSTNGIHHFHFTGYSGQLIGIMGGSGVGKSTLLNVLNGNIKPQSGQIIINGFDIHENKKHLEGVIGFVPQDDLLIEELTVYQNLFYNSKLCFDNFTKAQIDEAVDKVLKELGLNEIRNLTVGGPLNKFISGGQRKRLNIALELIREPAVLFVDEPTSGLSSVDSEIVMDLLKDLTLKGKLVVVNIHQPSSDIYKTFDKLIFMDKGGYPVYYGNPLDAVVYFKSITNYANADSECVTCGNVNPENVLQIIESKVVNEYGKLTDVRKITTEEWNEKYRENIESKVVIDERKEELPITHFKIPGKLKQFRIFSIRDLLSKLTNKQYLLITFLESPVLALIIAFFTKFIRGTNDNPNEYIFSSNENLVVYLFMSVVVALFVGMTVSAEEIIRDRKILQRETFLNLSRWSYLNSKVIIMFILSAIQTISFILVGNFVLGIQGMTINYWFILFTTSCFANMVGLNLSTAMNSVVTIYIMIPFIIVPQLLFSGVIVKFSKLHKSITSHVFVPFIGDVMTSRWAYEALAVEQMKNNKFARNFYVLDKQLSQAGFQFNFYVPELQSRLNECQNNITNPDLAKKVERYLKIIQTEIIDIQKKKEVAKIPFNATDSLTPKLFNAGIAQRTRDYLDLVKSFYIEKYNEVSQKKDLKYNQVITKLGNKEAVDKLKQDFFNESLSDLLTNKQEIHKIEEYEGRLIQVADPIYMDPLSNIGRAQFYAPNKMLFGNRIDTFWYNTSIIWLFNILLYIVLLTDSLKKLINMGSKFSFKKKGK